MCRTLKQKGGEEAEVVAVLNQRHISHRMESEHLFIFNFTLSGSPVEWLTFLLERKQTSGLNCKIFGNYYVHRTNVIEGDNSGVFVLFSELFTMLWV